MESCHFESQSAPPAHRSVPLAVPSFWKVWLRPCFHRISHHWCHSCSTGTVVVQYFLWRHTTNSALHREHAKPRLCNCNFTPHVTIYVENFVHRNPLIRDKILFQALFLDADQVYFLRYKHVNSATVFLLWHAGFFTRSDLDKNSCAYNLRTLYSNSNILGLPE